MGRNPDMPKKPLTSYMQFGADVRAQIKADNPDAKITEIAKLIGAQWQETAQEKKDEYKKNYESEMETYKVELEQWREENPDAAEDDGKGKKRGAKAEKGAKKKKDPNAPKRPLSAYFIWMGENRESVKSSNPDLDNKQLLSKLGELWGELTEEDKQPYAEKNA